MKYPILKSERLVLKVPTLSVSEAMTKLLQDEDVSKNLSRVPYPYHLENAQKFITQTQDIFSKENGESRFGIFLKEDDTFIGMCGLDISTDHNHGTLGYWLGKAYWGKGYATEATRRLLVYGFETLNLHRIACAHFHTNPASGNVIKKLGLKHEGIRRAHFKKGDKYLDIHDYGMLRSEYDGE